MSAWLRTCAAAAVLSIVFAGGGRAADVEKGHSLYRQICSHCHGPDMVNPGIVSFDLRKFPPDDEQRFLNAVINGKNSMPSLGADLTLDEIEDIFAYVKSGARQP